MSPGVKGRPSAVATSARTPSTRPPGMTQVLAQTEFRRVQLRASGIPSRGVARTLLPTSDRAPDSHAGRPAIRRTQGRIRGARFRPQGRERVSGDARAAPLFAGLSSRPASRPLARNLGGIHRVERLARRSSCTRWGGGPEGLHERSGPQHDRPSGHRRRIQPQPAAETSCAARERSPAHCPRVGRDPPDTGSVHRFAVPSAGIGGVPRSGLSEGSEAGSERGTPARCAHPPREPPTGR
jgi:hypothetical protein